MHTEKVLELNNGLKTIHHKNTSEVSHLGAMIFSGARHDLKSKNGTAHFVEHCLFKGTNKRKAFHILSSLDAVGGELNAYTTKEETFIFATYPKEYHQKAFDILSDIIFNSNFPLKEVEKEKAVIIDEINSYLDSPSELIFDEFEDKIFKNHSLGNSILGSEQSVNQINQKDLILFFKRRFNSKNIVLSYVGDLNHGKFEKYCLKYFSTNFDTNFEGNKVEIHNYSSFEEKETKDTYQTHVLLGNKAPSIIDNSKSAMILLNNILGGPALNSKLNLNIREKYGYAYHIESNYTPYSDAGIFNIYFGTDSKYVSKTMSLVKTELKKLTDNLLTELQLNRYKKQLIGQLKVSQESNNGLMISNARSLFYFNKIDTYEEVYEKINMINSYEILTTSQAVFKEEDLSTLIYD